MAALAVAFARRPAEGHHPAAPLLALAVGLTWASNGLEGGTVPLTAGVALVFLVVTSVAARRGAATTGLTRLVWTAFLPCLLLLGGYGLLEGGFPQPSE